MNKPISILTEITAIAPQTYIEVVDPFETNLSNKNKLATLTTLKAFLNGGTSASFADFDPAFTYLGSTSYYVAYSGNIWHFISPTDQTGVLPGDDYSVWELSSMGEFSHIQDTDLYLAFGTVDQVSAHEIRTFIDAGATTYSAGTGINISSFVISLDTSYTDGRYYTKTLGDARYLQLSGGTLSGNLNGVTPTEITYLSGATSSLQNQINAINTGITQKGSVRAATTANITLSGAQTIDGVSVIAGDRVLVKNQTTGSQNGIYVCASGSWTRSTDATTGGRGSTGILGASVQVEEGSTNADQIWLCTTDAPITIGTTSLVFAKSSGTTYTGSDGISLTGNNFALDNAYFSGDFTLSAGVATITKIRNSSIPSLATGNLRYNGSAWIFDSTTYLTANQTITLSGDISGSGTTAITTSIGAGKVTNAMLAGSIVYSKLSLTDSIAIADLSATGTPSSSTYLRGDNTWATVVGGVSSFNTRTGAVVPATADYTAAQVTNALDVTTTRNANLFYSGPSSGGAAAPTFRSIVTADLPTTAVTPGSYTSTDITVDATGRITAAANGSGATVIGNIFSESWTNLSSWTSVGTPSASVSGGQLTIAGTASLTTNFIRCSGYGNSNIESATYTWTETASTIGAGTSGKPFVLVGNGGFKTYSVGVNIELSSTSTGLVRWYSGPIASLSPTNPSTKTLSGLVSGSIINFKLTQLPDKFILEAWSTNSGVLTEVKDVFYPQTGNFIDLASFATPTAYQFGFLNQGGAHTVGAFAVSCNQLKGIDVLGIGNSIMTGYGNNYMYDRAFSRLINKYYCTGEILARPGNIMSDINTTEVALFNPRKILVWCGTNDISNVGAASAFTNLGTLVTALGSITTANAPSGYSTSNGNLVICTEIPITGSAAVATYNASVRSTHGLANTIDQHALATDGTTTLVDSYDGTHPSGQFNSASGDLIASYYGFKKREGQYNQSATFPSYIKGQPNCFIGNNMTAISGTSTNNMIGCNAYRGLSTNVMANDVAVTTFGQHVSDGFGVFTNAGQTKNTVVTQTHRFGIIAGNIMTGSTLSVVYRTTNAGSDVSAHMMIDPASSVSSGIGWGFSTAGGFFATQGNVTRRILGAAIVPVNLTTTAGSEAMDWAIKTQKGGTAAATSIIFSQTNSFVKFQAGSTTIAAANFSSGTLKTTAAAGDVEYNNSFYQTKNSGLRYGQGGTIFESFVDAGNTSTTETDLYSYTTPASTLELNGSKLWFVAGGTFVSSATATRELKVYFGGTVIFDSGTLTISISASWTIDVVIIRVSSTVIRYIIKMNTEGAALASYTAVGELTGLTLSATNILKITGQAASTGAATNDIVAKACNLMWIPVSNN